MKLISAPNITKLISNVNAEGLTPACGLTYHEGLYWQPVSSQTMGGVAYTVIDASDDVSFQVKATSAEDDGAIAIGELIVVNGRYLQAYGVPVVPTDTAGVLSVINSADADDPAYSGQTAYVKGIVNSFGDLDEDSPDAAGLRAFIQKVIDAQTP